MIRRPPRSTRTYTLFPYTTLFRSAFHIEEHVPEPETSVPFDSQPADKPTTSVSAREYQAIESTPSYPGKAGYQEEREALREARPRHEWNESRPSSKQEVKAYQELLKTPDLEPTPAVTPREPASHVAVESLGKAMNVVQGRYVMMADKSGTCLVNLAKAEWLRVNGQLSTLHGSLKSQPLLVPLSLKLDDELLQTAEQLQATLVQFGIELKSRSNKALMVMGVPQPLRQQNLQQLIPDLLSYAASFVAAAEPLSHSQIANWLSDQITQVKSDYTLSEAIQIIADIEQLWQGQLPLGDFTFVRPVDFSATIAAFEL